MMFLLLLALWCRVYYRLSNVSTGKYEFLSIVEAEEAGERIHVGVNFNYLLTP